MPRVDLALFDLAGTVIVDSGLVEGAFRRVATELGLEVGDAWLKARQGLPKRRYFSDMLALAGQTSAGGGTSIDELSLRFERALMTRFHTCTPKATEGADECLRRLVASGVRVGFVTGFDRQTMELLLDRMGWLRLAAAAVTAEDVVEGRPSPHIIHEAMRRAGVADASRVAAIGDTPNDLISATAAGCGLVVGVGHGSHALAELRAHPHTHLVEDLASFADLVLGVTA